MTESDFDARDAKMYAELYEGAYQDFAALYKVLTRIASMPIDPRPDGTHNYSREALIRMAQEAVK